MSVSFSSLLSDSSTLDEDLVLPSKISNMETRPKTRSRRNSKVEPLSLNILQDTDINTPCTTDVDKDDPLNLYSRKNNRKREPTSYLFRERILDKEDVFSENQTKSTNSKISNNSKLQLKKQGTKIRNLSLSSQVSKNPSHLSPVDLKSFHQEFKENKIQKANIETAKLNDLFQNNAPTPKKLTKPTPLGALSNIKKMPEIIPVTNLDIEDSTSMVVLPMEGENFFDNNEKTDVEKVREKIENDKKIRILSQKTVDSLDNHLDFIEVNQGHSVDENNNVKMIENNSWPEPMDWDNNGKKRTNANARIENFEKDEDQKSPTISVKSQKNSSINENNEDQQAHTKSKEELEMQQKMKEMEDYIKKLEAQKSTEITISKPKNGKRSSKINDDNIDSIIETVKLGVGKTKTSSTKNNFNLTKMKNLSKIKEYLLKKLKHPPQNFKEKYLHEDENFSNSQWHLIVFSLVLLMIFVVTVISIAVSISSKSVSSSEMEVPVFQIG